MKLWGFGMARKKSETITVSVGTIVIFNSGCGAVPAIVVRSTADGENLVTFRDNEASGCPDILENVTCDFEGAVGSWTPLS